MVTYSRYEQSHKDEWDAFVRSSRNGTFMLERSYMDYHSDRFVDSSLLFYDAKGLIIGAFAANYYEETATFFAHQGLTYGGLLLAHGTSTQEALEMLDETANFARSLGAKSLVYKPIPYIYHTEPSQEDLYWLHTHNATLLSRGLSTCINLGASPTLSTLRKRKVRKAENAGVEVVVTTNADDFQTFWDILADVLISAHGVHPVHTTQEILALRASNPDNISLYVAKLNGAVVAGSLVYKTPQVTHTQYLASNAVGRECGALDKVISTIMAEANTPYVDFGISTESNGYVLNEGLLFQKEGFGGHALCYDIYKVDL